MAGGTVVVVEIRGLSISGVACSMTRVAVIQWATRSGVMMRKINIIDLSGRGIVAISAVCCNGL
jgi:hypothetical protein